MKSGRLGPAVEEADSPESVECDDWLGETRSDFGVVGVGGVP